MLLQLIAAPFLVCCTFFSSSSFQVLFSWREKNVWRITARWLSRILLPSKTCSYRYRALLAICFGVCIIIILFFFTFTFFFFIFTSKSSSILSPPTHYHHRKTVQLNAACRTVHYPEPTRVLWNKFHSHGFKCFEGTFFVFFWSSVAIIDLIRM